MKLLLKILMLLPFLLGCAKANKYKPCVGYSENVKVGIDKGFEKLLRFLQRKECL